MLRRIQGWLKGAGGLGVAAACLAGSAVFAEDENPKIIQLKPRAEGGAVIQVLEEGKDGKITVRFGEEKEGPQKERQPERPQLQRKDGEKKEGEAKEPQRKAQVRLWEPREAYWIGIHCEPIADDSLRAQLNLGEGRGLLVRQVVPGSPAAKAGLKEHDVLIQSGDTLLDDVGTLVDLVAKNKDGELKLKIIRGGETQTVTVKPAKRGGEGGFGQGTVIVGEQNDEAIKKVIRQLEEQMEKIRKGEGRGEVPKIQFFHPGVVLPPGAQAPGQPAPQGWIAMPQIAALPDNMSVTISKSGKNPAKVNVKQGEKSWEATEDNLESLPAEVRGHVQRMLGRGPFANPWGGARWMPNQPQGPQGGPQQPGEPLNPSPRNPQQPQIGEPNSKPQGEAKPSSTRRVIELEVTPQGELKRTEAKPGEPKPSLEKEAVIRLEKLAGQLQDQAQKVQAKVTGSVEERLGRAIHELHERFESIDNRLKKLEQRFPPLPPRQNQPTAGKPLAPTSTQPQTIIIREGEERGKKVESSTKPQRKNEKDDDDDDKDEKKKDKD